MAAQLIKCWPTELVVPGLSLAGGEDYTNRKRVSIRHNISFSSADHLDMNEIL